MERDEVVAVVDDDWRVVMGMIHTRHCYDDGDEKLPDYK